MRWPLGLRGAATTSCYEAELGTGNVSGEGEWQQKNLCFSVSESPESLFATCHLQRKAVTLTPITLTLQQKEGSESAERS